MTDSLKNKAELCRTLTLVMLASLIALFILWRAVLLPMEHLYTIIAIHAVPLLLFVPGILARRYKVFIWLCFVILLYFCQGVVNSFRLPSVLGVMGLLETLLTMALFCSAMMAGRYYARLQANP